MSVLVNFAYGANLSPSCLTARRGIHPISWRRGKLAGWTFDFTLRGLPILEPAFGNVIPCIHTWRKLVEQRSRPSSANGGGGGAFDLSLSDFLSALTVHSSMSSALDSACDCYVEGVCYELTASDFDRLMRFEGTSISAHKRSDWGYIPLQLTFNVEKKKHAALNAHDAPAPIPAASAKQEQTEEFVGDWLTQELDSIEGYVLTAPAHWNNFYEYESLNKSQRKHWKNRSCECMISDGAVVASPVHFPSDHSSDRRSDFSPVSVHLVRQRCNRLLPSARYVSLLADGARQLHLSQRYRHDIAEVRELAVKHSLLSVLALLALIPLAIAYFVLLSPFLLWRFNQRRFITMAPFKLRTAAATQFLFGVPIFRVLFDCAWTVEEFIHQIRNSIWRYHAAQPQQQLQVPKQEQQQHITAPNGHSRGRGAFVTTIRGAYSPGLDISASTVVAPTGDDAVAS